MEYLMNVSIGTPAIQNFLVVPDTGSAHLWVPDTSCKEKLFSDCRRKRTFDSSLSQTYRKDGRPWSIFYADGSNANGHLGIDTFNLGDEEFGTGTNHLLLKDLPFGQATSVHGFANDPADGIFGLSFTTFDNGIKSPMVHAVDQNILDEPIFTGLREGAPGGSITFGGFDSNNCEEIIDYEPLTTTTYWQFAIKGIAAGDYSTDAHFEAISDTGTSFIGGPQNLITRIAEAVDAQYDYSNDLHTIDCNAKASPISITIGNNIYKITPENYIVEIEPNECVFGFFSVSLSGGYGPTWILGNPFIREYCQVHDIRGKRIGFAPSKRI
ncbi:unnamed protein product [Anisakis simplex]|uniref:Peptidase A1 domain-containing protein n=1 Tax=Anisakis simplex TaxID=6269 RepID=A0A0M3JV06_ANISI|nr:unnamed protein product [Anisakis simplex]